MGKVAEVETAGKKSGGKGPPRAGGRAAGTGAALAFHGLLALATLLAIVSRGYHFGKQDQNLYFPFILHWNDPSLFPQDLLLGLPYARQSITWSCLALLSRWVSLETICLVLYVGCSYLVLLLTYKTALLWWRDRRVAWLAVILWIPTYWVPGVDNSTFDDYFTTRLVGTVFGMSLLYAALKGRPRAAGAFVFLGGVAHIISGAPIAAGTLLAAAVRKQWRLAAWVAGGFLCSAAAVMVLGQQVQGASRLVERYSGEWLDIVLRADPELFPHLWRAASWHALGAYVLAFFALFLWRWRHGRAEEAERKVLWVCVGVVICSLVGLAGSVFHLGLVVQFCLFRGYLFFMWLLALYMAGVLSPALEDSRWAVALGGAWVAGSWLSGQVGLMILALPVLALGLNWEAAQDWARKNLSGRRRLLGWSAALAVLALLLWSNSIAFYLFGLNLEEWFLGKGAYLTAAAFTALFVLFRAAGLFRGASAYTPAMLSLMTLLMVMVPPPSVTRYLWASPTARRLYGTRIAVAGVTSAAKAQQQRERQAMCLRVRDLVPRDGTVLVPLDWMDFRLLSLRSPYVTLKDGAPCEFSRAFSLEWRRRLERVGGLKSHPGTLFSDRAPDLTEGEVVALARDEADLGLRFIVTPREYGFPLLARSGRFNLYEIPKGAPRSQGDGSGKGSAGREGTEP